MTRKSRSTAARYSALNKEGKKRQQPKHPHQVRTMPAATDQDTAKPTAGVSPIPSPISKVVAKPRSEVPPHGYQYVAADLKRIGLIAGAIIVIIIVLAFVLG